VGTLGDVLVVGEKQKFYFKDGNIIWFKRNSDIESEFIKFLFDTNVIKDQININSNLTTVGTLTIESAKNYIVPLPSVYEQKYIVCFLKKKTDEIESLISDKELLIELLEEKRQAIITETVTKGLNPNVKMKDSGIEWIGEIPEHWVLNPLFTVLREV